MSGIIIVTGAFGALGRAVTTKLVDQGLLVASVDLSVTGSGRGQNEYGGVNLTDEDSVARCFSTIAATHGPVAGLVNVAGGFTWQMMADGDIDGWDRMYRMNLRTAAVACKTVLPHLSAEASLVTVAAAAVNRPAVGMAPYVASKAGVIALTESLAEELRPRRIRVNAILPTIIDTSANRADMPDADFSAWVAPEDLASVVSFLLSDASSCITGASIRTR